MDNNPPFQKNQIAKKEEDQVAQNLKMTHG